MGDIILNPACDSCSCQGTVTTVVGSLGTISLSGGTNGVLCLAQAGNLLYLGGDFTTATDASGSVTRNNLACLDLTTQLWTSFDPNANDFVNATA